MYDEEQTPYEDQETPQEVEQRTAEQNVITTAQLTLAYFNNLVRGGMTRAEALEMTKVIMGGFAAAGRQA